MRPYPFAETVRRLLSAFASTRRAKSLPKYPAGERAPRVFSYHEAFHICVVAGSAVHYAMMFAYVARFTAVA